MPQPTAPSEPAQLTLISGLPSPFARMPRIALALKKIPFTLLNENPWESSATTTRLHNPLQKLPILIVPAASPQQKQLIIHDSTLILEYIVRRFPDTGPRLMPRVTGRSVSATPGVGYCWREAEEELFELEMAVKQIVVLAQGCCDALILARWEGKRGEGKTSEVWMERLDRRVDGVVGAFSDLVSQRVHESGMRSENGDVWLVGEEITIADIAVGVTMGWIEWWGVRPGWKTEYPVLKEWFERVDGMEEFVQTRPEMIVTGERVV